MTKILQKTLEKQGAFETKRPSSPVLLCKKLLAQEKQKAFGARGLSALSLPDFLMKAS